MNSLLTVPGLEGPNCEEPQRLANAGRILPSPGLLNDLLLFRDVSSVFYIRLQEFGKILPRTDATNVYS